MSMERLWSGISYDALVEVYDLEGPRADWVAWLGAHPGASVVLWDAADAIRKAFGLFCSRPVARLQPAEGEAWVIVTVKMPTPPWRGDPERCLAAFHQDFWLKRCELAEGLVVVDYEVQAPHAAAELMPFVSAYY
jgi:hypothetical protein